MSREHRGKVKSDAQYEYPDELNEKTGSGL